LDKSTIFISHSNPEDNYFAAWLSSRLYLCGYQVWCDLDEFRGGETMWQDIENVINIDAIKFVMVITDNYFQKAGTLKEWEIAKTIQDRNDFIIPLRISDLPFNEIPINEKYIIDFSCNWANGFQSLLDKLQKDRVSNSAEKSDFNLIEYWNKGLKIVDTTDAQRIEKYISNWFKITLPEKLYIHKPSSQISKKDIKLTEFAAIENKSYILTFACGNCMKNDHIILDSDIVDTHEFIKDGTYYSNKFNTNFQSTNNFIIDLLNKSMGIFLSKSSLKTYAMSKYIVHYFPKGSKGNVIKKRSTTRLLCGLRKNHHWHYALNFNAFLYPFHAYFVESHVIFTDKKGIPVSSSKQHKLRRSACSDWYNAKWRDILLAAIDRIDNKEYEQLIKIPCCCCQSIDMGKAPIQFNSPIGYNEPV